MRSPSRDISATCTEPARPAATASTVAKADPVTVLTLFGAASRRRARSHRCAFPLARLQGSKLPGPRPRMSVAATILPAPNYAHRANDREDEMYRVIVLYDQEPDADSYAEHVQLCKQ